MHLPVLSPPRLRLLAFAGTGSRRADLVTAVPSGGLIAP